MKLLAIDTSSLACTVAVQNGAGIVEKYEEQPREHTRILLPMIKAALSEAATELRDLDGIVLGNGPGSFIGMRIGASVAQGLAHGAGLRIIPVSSLAVVAAQVFSESDAENVAVAQDAHMNQVYLGLYRRGETDALEPVCSERLQELGAISELNDLVSVQAAGVGWQQYPDLLAANAESVLNDGKFQYPRASYLLRLADPAKAVDPAHIEPAYLRNTVAKKPAPSKS